MKAHDLAIGPLMTYGDMRRYADSLGVAVCSRSLPGELEGFYHASGNLIVVDRGMDYTSKRCALAHELVHWSHNDSACEPVIHARAENRTRRETAMLLIPASDYELAERVYEGDAFRIAAELDVTRQVVADFQRLVLS
jgi:Zn-dependent peptidase ImmA (M78 family)